MDLTTKVIEVYPIHTLSELIINGERFCYVLEDTLRPTGSKVNSWTALPRTGLVAYYNIGIRFSPGFGREMLSIYNQPDKVTIKLQDMKFVYAMFHGGNDATHTEGCPLVGYNLVDRIAKLEYNGKEIAFNETIIQGSAEADLFNLVAPVIKSGEEIRLFML